MLQRDENMLLNCTIYSSLYYIPNGNNENWQKAIGAHNVWLNAVIEKRKNKYNMYTNINFRDKYSIGK
jgi:hypothetical protein